MFLILQWLMVVTLAHSASECPTQPISAKSLSSPDTFRQWLQKNAGDLKTVEDLICCLPDAYLKNYVVSHSGRAGQNGSPESPRTFMFSEVKNGKVIFTFNGGAPYLNQPHNIEMGFIKDDKTFEIYDIEFYRRYAEMSEKNPARCLRCHSEGTTQEARPFFHMHATTNFVAGAPTCSGLEDDIQTRAQTLSLKAIVENPRFRCLDRAQAQNTLSSPREKFPKFAGPFVERLKQLRETFRPYQRNRLAKLISESPNYEEYKFITVGAEICPNFKAEDWMPPAVISQHNTTAWMRPEVAAITEQKDVAEAHTQLKEEFDDRERILKKILKSDFDLRRGSYRPVFQGWLCPSDPSFQKGEKATLASAKNLGKYEIDTKFRVFPETDLGHTALFRFLTEGRNVDSSTWSLAFNAKDDLHVFDRIADQLVALETPKSPLRATFPGGAKLSTKPGPETCEKLRQESLKALGSLVSRKPAELTQVTDRPATRQ